MNSTNTSPDEAGRRKALAGLVRAQAGRLYGIALRITGEPDLAGDAVQETFVRVLEGRDPPPDPDGAAAWLARVAANQALEILRRRAARRRREERYAMTRDETQDPGAPTLSPDEERILTSELGRLEPETRAAIWLHEVEGVSLRDAADALGSSRSSVARRIASGLALLRKRLEGRGVALRGAAPLPALLGSLPVPQAPASLLERLDAIGAAAQAGAAGAGAALGATVPAPVSHTITIGGLLMSGKKIAISLGLSALILGGAAILVKPWDRARNAGDPALADGSGAAIAPTTKDASPGASGAETGRAADAVSASGEARSAGAVSLRGRVAGEDGEPVSGARVIALALSEWRRVGEEESPRDRASASPEELVALREAYRKQAASLPEVRTAGDGTFAFRTLRSHDYRLLASHPEYLPSVDARAEVGGAVPDVTIRLLRGSMIRGKVVDLDGAPVAGARVSAEPSGSREQGRGVPAELADWESGLRVLSPGEAISAEDGSFALPSLEPVHHDLAAAKDGYLEGNAWGIPAGASGCAIVLDAGTSVSGRIVDEAGAPIAGASIHLKPARSSEVHRIFDWSQRLERFPGADERRAVSGENGRFRIAGLFPASHDLSVSKEGRSPALREIDVGDEAVDVGDVPLDPARRITGIVRGPDRAPCAGARVAVTRPRKAVQGANSLARASLDALLETESDAGGRFVLEGVPGNAFGVAAEKEGFEAAELHGIDPGTEDLEIVLGEGYTIAGKVVDPERSAGVEGAEVTAGFHRERKTTSRADGTFEIRGLGRRDVHRGTAWVRANHPDYAPCSAQVAVAGTGKAAAIIRLSRAGRLRGRVVDGSGAPVEGARVWIEVTGLTRETVGWNPVSGIATVSLEDGSFVLAPPESLANTIGDLAVEVLVADPRFAPGRAGPFSLPRHGDDWRTAEIVLGEGGMVRGRVRDATGKDVARARIAARRPAAGNEVRASALGGAAGPEAVTYSAKDGSYILRSLEAGPLEIEVLSMDHARKIVGGIEVAGSPVEVDIVLDAGGALEGRVVDEAGEPMPEVEVAALPDLERDEGSREIGAEFMERMETMTRRGRESARTSADGRFSLRRLPDGVYRIIARTPGFEPAVVPGVRPGEAVSDITLLRYSAIRGRVLERTTRRPVRSFVVEVIDKKKRADLQKRTSFKDPRLGTEGTLRFDDPLGRFSFDGLRPAEYAVTIAAPGLVATTRDVTLATGTEHPVEFLLDAGGAISGVVLDAESGAPVAGASVGVGPERYDEPDSSRYLMEDVLSAADGSFTVQGLRDGKYNVMAGHPFYRRDMRMVPVEVRAGEPTDPVEVRLAPGGRLEVEVKGMPRGHPRKASLRYSVHVMRVREEAAGDDDAKDRNPWEGFIPVHQDSSGRFAAEGLEPGVYAVNLEMQEMEEGESIQLGPMGGFSASRPKGEKKVAPLGNVEVRPGETAWLEGKVP